MTGIVVRLVLAFVALGGAVHLLRQAKLLRDSWRRQQMGLERAEAWWATTHGGPFDQNRPAAPADVVPYLGPTGPRTELRTPQPAQAQWVWGWLLVVIAVFLLVSVAAQTAG